MKVLIQFPFNLIEAFVGEKFEELVLSPSIQAEVCGICVEKFEDYDKHCLEAARIQDEITTTFRQNQAMIKMTNKSLKSSICEEQCFNYEEVSSECEIDDQYDIVEYAEELEETMEALKKEPKKVESTNYTCNKCNKKFQRKREYQLHLKLSHMSENAELFSCSQCKDEAMFASEMEYRLHVIISHPLDLTAPSFECPVCTKVFTTKAVLNRHFGIHSSNSERPHVCEICGKTFFHFSSFRAHLKIHADIRDFPCTQCSKSFRSQSHLNRHLKIHTKQKDHECPGLVQAYHSA